MLPPVTRPVTAAITSTTPSMDGGTRSVAQRSGVSPCVAPGSTSLATMGRSASLDLPSSRQRRGQDARDVPRSVRSSASAPHLGRSSGSVPDSALGLLTDRMEAPEQGTSIGQLMDSQAPGRLPSHAPNSPLRQQVLDAAATRTRLGELSDRMEVPDQGPSIGQVMDSPAPGRLPSHAPNSPLRQQVLDAAATRARLGELSDRMEAPDQGTSIGQTMDSPAPGRLPSHAANSPLRQQALDAAATRARLGELSDRMEEPAHSPSIHQALASSTPGPLPTRPPISSLRQQLAQLGRQPTPPTPPPPVPNPAATAAANAPLAGPTMTMALHDHQLQMGAEPLDHLVQAVLGKPENRFQLLDAQHHLLLDTDNRLVHAHAGPGAITLLKGSVALSSPLPPDNGHLSVGNHGIQVGQTAATATGTGLKLPESGLLAQINGVHQGHGKHWRTEDKKLYQLTASGWEAQDAARDYSSLHSLGRDAVYGIDDDGKVRALQDPQRPLAFLHKASDVARTASGDHLAITKENETFNIELLRGDAASQVQPFAIAGRTGPLGSGDEPKALAVAGNAVFVATANGKLLSADINQLPLSFSQVREQPSLAASLGAHRFTGLFTDSDGTLHAKVKGANGQEHACPMQEGSQARPAFQPGWNMTQALTLDSRRGLPDVKPPTHEQLHLPYGSIAAHDKQLMLLDARTGLWKKAKEKDLQDVQIGQDKNAYIVTKEGEVKPLAVNEQSASHQFNDGPDLNLPGRTTEVKAGSVMPGLGGIKAEKIAVLNDQRFVTLSEGKLRVHDQKRPRHQLPATPGGGKVTALATGGKDLFALSGGSIHRMDGATWASNDITPRRADAWQAVPTTGLTGGAILQMRTGSDGQLLARTADGEFALDGNAWSRDKASTANAPSNHGSFGALKDREALFGVPTVGHLPKLDPTAKFDTTVFGRGNAQQLHAKELAPTQLGFLKAHLLPSRLLKTPAMLKVAEDYVEHKYRGRAGLSEVYQAQEGALQAFDQLRTEQRDSGNLTRLPTPSIGDRLQALKTQHEDPATQELLQLFEWLSKEVTDSLHLQLRTLGEHSPGIGLSTRNPLNLNSGPNPGYRPSTRAQDNFVEQLHGVLQEAGLPRDNPARQLLDQMRSNHVVIERSSSKLPGSRRDGHDDMSLVKARLAHNAVLFNDIEAQLTALETALAGAAQPTAQAGAAANAQPDPVQTVAANLADLHNRQWGNNQLKQLTDAGFNNHTQLEADYDALKSILKYLRKEHHPVSMNLRQGLETDQARIGEKLLTAIRELEPRENIKINRVYSGGGAATLGFDAGIAVLGPRVSVDPERTYALTLTRFDRGLKVSIGRDGALTVGTSMIAGGVVTGKDAGNAGNVPGSTEVHTSSSGSDHERHTTVGGRFGGSLDVKNKFTQTQALSFFVREDELDAFIHDLTSAPLNSSKNPTQEGLRPMALIDRGVEHEVRTGQKYNLDVETTAAAEFRVSVGQTKAKPVSGFMRFGAGLVATQSLLGVERQRTAGRGDDGLNTRISSDNRARFFEQTKLNGYARLFDTAFVAQPDGAFISGGIPMGISASLVLNSKTGKSFDSRFKAALPPQQSEVDALEKSLKEAFPDIEPLPKADEASKPDPLARFTALSTAYGGQAATVDDSQYAALKSLRQMQRQVTAAEQGGVLMTMMDMTITHNNIRRVGSASNTKRAVDWATQYFREGHQGNAEIIQGLMAKDPHLKSLLDTLQKGSGTRAEVILELRDDIKEQIETAAANGTLDDEQLKRLVTDRNNLRISSIAVFKAATKEDSFVLPTPWVNYSSSSSLSVERLQGEVNFEYGKDQLEPKSFKLKGERARSADTSARVMAEKGENWTPT
ncbi:MULTISPECIES: AvrE-family type 3 secretion system effector [unclassified Pseudomonas]|uniref:AvrE-family type 3 secretion system effector n=1 Tax=unclassified Pseudomonas TaxID=196821 RepID=UPI000D34212B|nr:MULTISPECIES: AvrE-family type 3 secretion system effector [unclassified Pseudomonas]RAU44013.1 AvrE-family type 3 secretion system effector [Pseudomonas sp. RIT 409]RAU54758.1 AvrE-family type 3 secretion system effector [Pseudomonas sp. RIT 412]